jgi:repressor LexA
VRVINEHDMERMFEYIKKTQETEFRSPSQREMQRKLRMTPPRCLRYTRLLAERGKISIENDGRIFLPHKLRVDANTPIPFGSAQLACGEASYLDERFEGMVSLPEIFTGSGEFVMIRAKGRSMERLCVRSGDYLVIRKQHTADSGDIVIAVRTDEWNGEQTDGTLKKYVLSDNGYVLRPYFDDDDEHDDIPFTEGYSITGKLVTLVRKY